MENTATDLATPMIATAAFGILVIGLVMRGLHQPHAVAYILAGVVLGPHGLALMERESTLTGLGSLGVMFLLFFVGMEVSPRQLMRGWRVAVLGTLMQILLSVAVAMAVAWYFQWPWQRGLLLGFVISLSSTVIVIKMLHEWQELDTRLGSDVLGILLAQDLAVIPMLSIIALLGGGANEASSGLTPLIGAAVMLLLAMWMVHRGEINLPFSAWWKRDQEMQLFAALSICFGFAALSAAMGLSAALGAFIAGMIVAMARETKWVHRNLEPFRVIFTALFFVSIGMLVNVRFLSNYWHELLTAVAAIMALNTLLNTGILRSLGLRWRESLYAGALLSQIGEFSFVLAALGLQSKLISSLAYQVVINIIILSLLISPLWIKGMRAFTRRRSRSPA